ncbi:hypothetical protein FRC08_004210 [Ceratobasidium sp. 394]|nr:hypothetical protein FRC08_004210 [Ceratobasidium sp. 394]
MKRAGSLNIEDEKTMVIRCPACPRDNVNYLKTDVAENTRYAYTTHISYDGSFQLVQRQRAEDEHDTCLTGGDMFFVDSQRYEDYLADIKDDAFRNTKISDCNNHKAAIGAWTLYEGLAVTGIGACSCARHAFYLPRGVVNYFKGERFAYTDFAVASVMNLLQGEGCNDIGFYYDIYCHWSRNWWTRAGLLPIPIYKPVYYKGGIPKYHLAGHTDACYILYSLNNMPGVGRLDAEGCERLWANANQASGSVANKGSGARIDTLNHLFQDWNWRKTTSIGIYDSAASFVFAKVKIASLLASLLVRKLKQAIEMAAEKKSQWELFNECISPELRAAWEKLDTKPTYEGKMLKSVYVAPAPEPTSVTQKMRTLRKMEHTSDSSRDDSSRDDSSEDESEPFTPSDWIEEGLEIERIQERLRRDVNTQGGSPTPSQALDIGRRRDALQRRRTRHTKDAAIFFTSEQLALYVAQGDSDRDAVAGKPEMGTLALPSRMPRFRKDAHSRSDRALIEVELSKRVNACLKALVDLRTTSQQKALLIQQKQKHVRGEIKNTRVQTMISRLTDRVNLAVWEY